MRMPGQNNEKKQQKKKLKTKSRTNDSDAKFWNLETLFKLYKSFSFIAKNNTLHYVPIKILSNQASKQLGIINDDLKMQKILLYRRHDIENKLLIIIYANKISVQKEINFSQTKPRAFTLATCFENPQKAEGHLIMYFHQLQSR